MRKLIAPLAAAAAVLSGFAVPAHAEQVVIGVTVNDDFSATAVGTSTKPGETFGDFQVVRVSATDSLSDPHATTGGASVPGIDGTTTGVATYVVNAHPMDSSNEPKAFFFTSVTVCVKSPAVNDGHVVCTAGVGENTVISALTGP